MFDPKLSMYVCMYALKLSIYVYMLSTYAHKQSM